MGPAPRGLKRLAGIALARDDLTTLVIPAYAGTQPRRQLASQADTVIPAYAGIQWLGMYEIQPETLGDRLRCCGALPA